MTILRSFIFQRRFVKSRSLNLSPRVLHPNKKIKEESPYFKIIKDIIQQSTYLGVQVAKIDGRFSELPPEMTEIKSSVAIQMDTAIELRSKIDEVEANGNRQIQFLRGRISSLEAETTKLKSSNELLEEKVKSLEDKNTKLEAKVKSLENENTRKYGEKEKEKEWWESWRQEVENMIKGAN
ncbi:uncharacterized protein LOC124442664 [Xenia sp. Carnegie-2017]|uniref:uncharacterized protein LOC124442664 n=1 Tax=Xenia sp. Carnegie-2017 TaxID=2897299 RepID=UPI001F04E30B|nr:uncharacterized protein LOC124442664 [Xenia sp. Carnegie-2017]